jgi:hypothetical protein
MNFIVGSNIICFYILLKRLEKGGNQFSRLLPGRILETGRCEGNDYQPPPKLETIFVRQKAKVQGSIVDPRIYGFVIITILSKGSVFHSSSKEVADAFGESCPDGLMRKHDGHILLPAVVSQYAITSGFLVTLGQKGILKTFCVLVNYQYWPGSPQPRLQLKYFNAEAAPELFSARSFEDLSNRLEGMRVPDLGVGGRVSPFISYKLNRGRVVVAITITILG